MRMILPMPASHLGVEIWITCVVGALTSRLGYRNPSHSPVIRPPDMDGLLDLLLVPVPGERSLAETGQLRVGGEAQRDQLSLAEFAAAPPQRLRQHLRQAQPV